MPGVPGIGGVCPNAQRPLPVHGNKDILFQLPRTLLQAGHAGKDPGSHALCRPPDDISPSGDCSPARHREQKREEKIGE